MKPEHKQRVLQAALLVGVWFGVAVISALQSYMLASVESEWKPAFSLVLRWQVISWAPWILFTPPILWLARRVQIERGRWAVPILLHLLVGTAVVLLHTASLSFLTRLVVSEAAAEPFSQIYLGLLGVRFVTSLLVYGGVLGVGHALDFHRKYREGELVASQLETQLARAHLNALKMQLHPHFLFNTLHAVSVLIKEDPAAASKMVTRLGDFLRLAIDTVGMQQVSLKEELEFLELYLAIEQTRFQDRLTVSFDIDPETLGAQVPSFILQPLVENSIKHGIGQRAGEGRINVRSTRANGSLTLSVEDAGCVGVIRPAEMWKDGVGLRTTRERLFRMYGEDHGVDIETTDNRVCVSLMIPYCADRIESDG